MVEPLRGYSSVHCQACACGITSTVGPISDGTQRAFLAEHGGHPIVVTTYSTTTFEQFFAEVEREAQAAGPEAVAELNVLRIHWRATLAEMKERLERKGKEFCICGISEGSPYRPDERVAWRHLSHCPHALIKKVNT